MSTNKIRKINTSKTPLPARADYGPATAGIEFDMGVSTGELIVNPDGTRRKFNSFLSSANVGTKSGTGVTVVEQGSEVVHKTVFTFTNTPLTLLDLQNGNGLKIYTFPKGGLTILGASGSVKETTTSALASTLNPGVTYNWGIGTTIQMNGTLATTEQDIIQSTNGTASATINVEAAASKAVRSAAPAPFDGSTVAKAAFFNVGIALATDIDADATVTFNGTITIVWVFSGDV